MTETASFLANVGKIYNAFSVHDKGTAYDILSLPEAIGCLNECVRFLDANEEHIRDVSHCNLPKDLKGPHGHVASITVESLKMISSGLKRLNGIVDDFSYEGTNLLSCLSLDCEHFHASQHFKSVTMSMQEYCSQSGNTL